MAPQNNNSARRGSPLRFSLRTALAVMLLCALLLGGWRVYPRLFEREQAAAQALVDAGAATEFRPGGPAWLRIGHDEEQLMVTTKVNLESVEFHDELLPQLLELRSLRSLVVSGEGFTYEHLRKLRALSQLRFLILDSTSVTEEQSQAFVAQHPDLRIHRSQARAIAAVCNRGGRVNNQTGQLIMAPQSRVAITPLQASRLVRRGDLLVTIGPTAIPTGYAATTWPTTPAPNPLEAIYGQQHFESALDVIVPRQSHGETFDDAAKPLKHMTTLTHLEIRKRDFSDDDVVPLPHLPRLRELQLDDNHVSDVGLAQLAARMPQLERFNLSQSRVADDGMQHVAKWTNLTELVLHRTRVGDIGLAHIARTKQLQLIDLSRTRVTDDGLAHLVELPRLTSLNLSHTAVTDAGMRHVGRLSSLKELDLGETRISDDGLRHLAQLTNLETLNLNATEISDAGLAHLAQMKNLQSLRLAHTAISDSAVEHLRRHRSLQWLDLSFTKFSLQAAGELEKHLPNNPIVR